MKITGRRLNYLLTVDGSSYCRVKKSAKASIQRQARRRLNRAARQEARLA